ncbi:MAG: hypothetical protein SPK06_04590 [Kiritimatiellia bacterium]|nr:hypothetical protein [Kiritimatiellia bacterium]
MLNEDQKNLIAQWIAEGATLSQVQSRIKSEFGVSMTFLDVRLLVADLGATLRDPTPKASPQPASAEPVPPDSPTPPEPPLDSASDEEPITTSVLVELNEVAIPGTMVSGTVCFSDGQRGNWFIDNLGRFSLEPETIGYKPSDEDLRQFQLQLRTLLQRKGML